MVVKAPYLPDASAHGEIPFFNNDIVGLT